MMKKFLVILCALFLTSTVASAYTQEEAINLLKSKRIDSHSQVWMMNAVTSGDIELVKLFIDAKHIDLNKRYAGTPYLLQAIYCKHNQIALMLLENGADPRIKTIDGGSSLFFAVKNGQADVVKKILETPGIDIKRQRMLFRVPLKTTAKRKYPEIYEMLVEYEKQEAERINKEESNKN